uniref:Uncharacterized protein n=1 Tax=Brassica campestris TaxID=3711 RepID=M4F425_BRACM
MSDRVIPQSRCSPFTNGTADVTKEKDQKEEAVRLGVELSLCMAEAMFILSDDRRSMTYFCFFTLFKTKMDRRGPAVRRLYRVIQHVYTTYIKPKNLVYIDGGESTQSKLMGTFRQDFVSAIRGLAHTVSTLEIGCLVKPSVLEQYNQELKKLEENLGSVKDVSQFQRQMGLLGKQ